MKKMLFLTLAVLILSMVMTPAGGGLVQAQTLPPSYYESNQFGELFRNTPSRVRNFDVMQEGVVIKDEDLFIPQVQGLITVSGICELKQPYAMKTFQVRIYPQNATTFTVRPLHYGNGLASFSATFPATPFYVEGWQNDYIGGVASGRCILLMEAVN